jgi:hypothetical protein
MFVHCVVGGTGAWDFKFDSDTETIEHELYLAEEYQTVYGFDD